jgi:hypothetical protein
LALTHVIDGFGAKELARGFEDALHSMAAQSGVPVGRRPRVPARRVCSSCAAPPPPRTTRPSRCSCLFSTRSRWVGRGLPTLIADRSSETPMR